MALPLVEFQVFFLYYIIIFEIDFFISMLVDLLSSLASISSFQIVEVGKPLIGEKSPAVVKADLTISLPKRADIRAEWEG